MSAGVARRGPGWLVLLALLCCATATEAKAPRPRGAAKEGEAATVRARAKGALRAAPEAGAEMVGKVRAKERLELVERSADGRWAQVRRKRLSGWIESEALDGLPAAVAPAGPAAPAGAAAAPAPAPAPPAAAPAAPAVAPVSADPFGQGVAAYQRGAYDEAIGHFEQGYRAQPDPVYLYNIAQAQRLARRPEEALASYRRYLAAAPAAENRAEVEGRIAALEGETARAGVLRTAKEGRALVKGGQVATGIARLREALGRGEAAGLADEDMAELRYALGLSLVRGGSAEEAAAELRRAAELSPRDAEIRLDLALALRRADDNAGAEAAAGEALRLGLTGDDRQSAEALLRKARSQRLHDRLSVDANVTYGFDSNVLQGTQETIGDRFTGAARRTTTKAATRTAVRTIVQDIAQQYRTPAPARREYDLPLNLYLDVGGRLAGGRLAALWLEYHFTQMFMTLPRAATADDLDMVTATGIPYDPYAAHDPYNLQEHRATLRLRAEPQRWLALGLRAEGFANFSGLREFRPFQGGLTVGAEGTARETPRLQTRLTLTHQYRASFDRSVTADAELSATCKQPITDTDTIFDGNKTDLGLSQELRLRWLRARLAYQFHSDRTGLLEVDQPYYFTPAATVANPRPSEIVVGCYNYKAPLSYYAQEALLSGRFLLPRGFEIFVQGRYEYRAYDGLYGANFHSLPTVARPNPADVSLGYLPRRDHRVAAEVSLHLDLPKGFSLELGYSYTRNLSNIANGIDNRSYDKHVATLWGMYAF